MKTHGTVIITHNRPRRLRIAVESVRIQDTDIIVVYNHNESPKSLKMIKEIAGDLLDDKLGNGFNVISNNLAAAGQLVEHLHFHVIPRKEGDGIRYFHKG